MRIKEGTIITQTQLDIEQHTYTLCNNVIGAEVTINRAGALAVNKIKKGVKKGSDAFCEELKKAGFIEEGSNETKENFYKRKYSRYPLTSLAIEITDGCNLNCVHCYGRYSLTEKSRYISYAEIIKLIPELHSLGTIRVALTGGEVTTHPDFLKISKAFFESGFDVTIFSNGYNPIIIKKLLAANHQYHFTIKISLDGMEKNHNSIRGNPQSFKRTIETLDIIKEYNNVRCIISTVITKQNYDEICDLIKLINMKYRNCENMIDFAFPEGNALDNSCTFNLEEIDQIVKNNEVFASNNNDKKREKSTKHRCSGGVSQAMLCVDGSLSMCTGANQGCFKFKYNIKDKGVVYSWKHCGANISRYRREKNHMTLQCRKCKYINYCKNTDCRLLAYIYTGSQSNSNPLTCAAAKRDYEINTRESLR